MTDKFDKISVLFINYGIRSITMNEIASDLGISKKTLYQFVKNKEDLIRQVIHHEFHKKSSEVETLLKHDLNAVEQLIEIQKLIIRSVKKYSSTIEFDLKKYYPGIFKELNVKYVKLLEDLFIHNIQKGKKEGLYRMDLNESIVAKVHTSRILFIPQSKLISIDDYSSKEYMHEMINYHLRALLNKKSLSLLDKYIFELQ